MKNFWVTINMGRSDILDSELEEEELERWLQGKLEYATSLLDGAGKVQVDRVDPLRVDVALNFSVQGLSVVEVMERFRDDFRTLAPIAQGIEISESKRYKLVFPKVNGERFPVFVRIDPETERPIYSED